MPELRDILPPFFINIPAVVYDSMPAVSEHVDKNPQVGARVVCFDLFPHFRKRLLKVFEQAIAIPLCIPVGILPKVIWRSLRRPFESFLCSPRVKIAALYSKLRLT